MKIGFDVQYKLHDAVYAALRLSDSLKALGYETTLYSKLKKKHIYGCDWDSLVTTPEDMSYEEWLKTITHIIWPVPPNKDTVKKVGKNIVTIALAPWDCLPSYTKGSLKLCAHTVSTCSENTKVLKAGSSLTNISTIEWDSFIPITHKAFGSVDLNNPKVLIPLHSSQGLRCDLDSLFDIIEGVIHGCPKAKIAISYSLKSIPWEISKELRSFVRKHSSSVSLVLDAATCVSSLLLYGSHDIVLWPAEIEGFGLVGVESIYMGTPVIAYDVPPMSDIVIDGINGVLVPCKHGGSVNSIVFAEPDAYNFIDKSVDAINNKLVELNKHTKTGKKSKRSKFNSAWKKIIEG